MARCRSAAPAVGKWCEGAVTAPAPGLSAQCAALASHHTHGAPETIERQLGVPFDAAFPPLDLREGSASRPAFQLLSRAEAGRRLGRLTGPGRRPREPCFSAVARSRRYI